MTINQWRQQALTILDNLYSRDEATFVVRRLLEKYVVEEYPDALLLLDKDKSLSHEQTTYLNQAIERLIANEPLQYVLGEVAFHRIRLGVAPGILIPRPETEELVEIVLRQHGSRQGLRVLDLCSGSGCIALALASALDSSSRIVGVELSSQAIAIAWANVHRLDLVDRIELRKSDMLTLLPEVDTYDLIISNPPYIHPDEATQMCPRVLDHEPHMALFVPASDPTLYYKAIATNACHSARRGAHIYAELNPHYATQTLHDMTSILGERVAQAHLLEDMNGYVRFIHIILC